MGGITVDNELTLGGLLASGSWMVVNTERRGRDSLGG